MNKSMMAGMNLLLSRLDKLEQALADEPAAV